MIQFLTQTIMESLKKFEKDFDEQYPSVRSYTGGQMQEYLRSHLLQSQIKVIEAVIEKMLKSKQDGIKNGQDQPEIAKGYILALEDQISSLNQVKEEITNNL